MCDICDWGFVYISAHHKSVLLIFVYITHICDRDACISEKYLNVTSCQVSSLFINDVTLMIQ